MSDLISRKALLEEIAEISNSPLNEWSTVGVLNVVYRQPSAQQWIPIGQYPTEQSLLCFENGEMAVGKYDFEADEWDVQCSSEYFSCLDITDDEPIAWMPLPEPYKGE